MSTVDRNTGDSTQKETPEERRARIAGDPKRGKDNSTFIRNGKDNPDNKGRRSHQQKTREQRSGSLKRKRPERSRR